MRYKLVIPKVLPDFITGQELKDILTAQNFTIPRLNYSPPPTPPQPDKNIYPQSTWAGQEEWRKFSIALALVKAETKVIKAQYLLDMLNLTNLLAGMFTIATYVPVGHNANGTTAYDYRIVPDPAYKFSQCASRLTKLPSEEVINFICFKYFG